MKLLAAALAALVIIAGCAQPPVSAKADDSNSTPQKVADTVSGNNAFAFNIYRNLSAENSGGNIFMSPYSISSVMALATEGAKGNTSEELTRILKLPSEPSTSEPAFAKIYNTLNTTDNNYELYTANALWAEKSYKFLGTYVSTAANYYGAQASNLDFMTEPDDSKQKINSWVEQRTGGKIRGLVPSIDPLTKLIITNAVYFKGKWLVQFDSGKTHEADFRVSQGKTVKAQMMDASGEKANFKYLSNDELQAVELPYVGNAISMLVILPSEGKLNDVEASLSPQKLSEIRDGMRMQNVTVLLPKFKVLTKYSLVDNFKRMGVNDAFTPNADFSGMDGTKSLYISQMLHQAYIEVDEEGTEAAAATTVGIMAAAAVNPNIFNADHPFVFLIRDNRTGTILFAGKIVDPTQN